MHLKLMYKASLFTFFLMLVLVGFSLAEDPPVACFTADVLTGDIPLVVNFVDASTGEITSWEWDFGDESPISYDQSPTHIYTSPGTFNIILTVYGPGGSSIATSQVVAHAPLVACFSQCSTPGTFPLEVSFTDESIGDIISWAWDFGDESPISYEQNPAHTYTEVGDYCVTLTVTDSLFETAQATGEVKVEEVWTPDGYGHLNDPNGAWKVALVSAGFESERTGPNPMDRDWHIVKRDKVADGVYTSDPFNDPQWWDRTTLKPGDWPDGDAIDLKPEDNPELNQDPESPPDPDPQQTNNDRQYPICYVCDSKMKVKLVIKTSGAVTIEKYKGYQAKSTTDNNILEDGYHFPESSSPILTCDKKFPDNTVQYQRFLTIQWMVKINGKWGKLVPSHNQLYVIKRDPGQGAYTKHSELHYSCNYNNGKSDKAELFAGVWENFANCDKTFYRAEDKYQIPYESDKYFYYYGNTNWNLAESDEEGMILKLNGKCGAWGEFLWRISFNHNIVVDMYNIEISAITDGQLLFVKTWEFNDEDKYCVHDDDDGTFPYTNILEKAGFNISNDDWEYQNVDSKSGLKGQGCTNPRSIFSNHCVVKYNDKYYDPSYGKVFNSFDILENDSFAGYGVKKKGLVDETKVNLDLNDNGNKTDTNVEYDCHGIKQNPEGNQCKKTFIQ